MISSFGKFAKSLGAKIILTTLGLSMIIFWGLGGLTNLSLSRNKPAIKVGSDTISMQQLANAFDKERARMGAMMGGQYISPEQGIQNGLLQSAVQGQIIGAVSKNVRSELGLTASDNAVRKYVERNPAFADALGKFDKGIFYAYLAQMRMSETELAHKLRDELAMQHLTGTIADLGYNPTILAEAMYRYKNEKRSTTVAFITPEKIKIETEPTKEELTEYYEAYGDQFILPEYRTVRVVEISPQNMASKVSVNTEQVNEIFNQKRTEYGTPEKRQLVQILFKTKEMADSALVGLNATNFTKTAQEAGQTEEETYFGWVSQADIMTELSEPVFKANKNKIIGPIETSLGWHVIMVQDIQPATAPDENKIKADIKKQLANEQSYAKAEEIVKALEDLLGQGLSLTEAAKKLELTIKNIGTFDMTGTMKNGKTIEAAYNNPTLLQDIFLLETNEASAVIEHGEGYIVAEVTQVIPSKPQEFEAAKPELKKLWVAEKQKTLLQETADTILDRTQKGNGLQAQGAFKNFEVVQKNDITREKADDLPSAVVTSVFTQSVGAKNAIATPISNGIAISVVSDIKKANPKKDEFGVNIVKQNLKKRTGEGIANEVMGSYAEDFGVTVNEKEIMDAFSTYQTQE